MGNSPLTVCINQAFEKQTVQVVLPDGQVLFMPHPLTAAMLMEAHPSHIVCQGSPSLLEQRLPFHQRLESGEIYYLLPSNSVVPTTPTRDLFQNIRQQQQQSKGKQFPQRAPYKPPPAALHFDKTTSPSSFSDYARLNLKPQRCLINLFVFRQSVASIMPEESFKVFPQSQGDHYHQYGNKPRTAAAPAPAAPTLLNSKRNPPQFDHPPKQQHRGVRGRKQVALWKPHLESISETKPVLHDFSSSLPSITNNNQFNNYINNFSVPMISGVKALSPVPSPRPSPPGSPLNNLVLPLQSYGGHHYQQQFNRQQQQRLSSVIHSVLASPLAGDRDGHRQRFIYSA